MNIEIEVTESDIKQVVLAKLKLVYPEIMRGNYGWDNFQIKTTRRANETWRRPTYLRLLIKKELPLA